MKLSKYLSQQGVGANMLLAEKINVFQSDVSNWRRGSRPVPVNKCTAIEKATNGAVTRKDLRPDDWADIWPELKHE